MTPLDTLLPWVRPRVKETKHGGRPVHGDAFRGRKTAEYWTWIAMKARCYTPSTSYYHLYGGRGVTVCTRWLNDYAAFLADTGRKPTPSHTIDRIDTDGNYEPSNCRWATKGEQSRGRRRTVRLLVNGVLRPLVDVAKEYGMTRGGLRSRLAKGMTVEQALSFPARKHWTR